MQLDNRLAYSDTVSLIMYFVSRIITCRSRVSNHFLRQTFLLNNVHKRILTEKEVIEDNKTTSVVSFFIISLQLIFSFGDIHSQSPTLYFQTRPCNCCDGIHIKDDGLCYFQPIIIGGKIETASYFLYRLDSKDSGPNFKN